MDIYLVFIAWSIIKPNMKCVRIFVYLVLPQEDIGENKKYENNETEAISIEFQETPIKTPRKL